MVESAGLYVRKAGEEIVDQIYTFQDKSGRDLALRPEMTPSLARMVLQRGGALGLPIKWFSVPQCWRYERMTRGRRREHFQWNMDVFGVAEVTAEAELLAAAAALFEDLGLSARRRWTCASPTGACCEGLLEAEGVGDDLFAPVCVLLDKLEKVPREAVEEELRSLGVEAAVIDRALEFASCATLEEARALGGDEQGLRELGRLFELAAAYGCAGWLRFDPSLVRGLAYYTGVVFEAFPARGELRALCGGGRYDRLLSAFGGRDVPACGFGFGDAVIVELLKDLGRLPELPAQVDDVVFAFAGDLRAPAMEVAARLRRAGRSVDLVLEERRMKWAFRHADAAGAARLVLLAPEEWERGVVKVRDLSTGEEVERRPEELG